MFNCALLRQELYFCKSHPWGIKKGKVIIVTSTARHEHNRNDEHYRSGDD